MSYCLKILLVTPHLFRYNGQAAQKGRRGRGFFSILQGKEVGPMPVTLLISIVLAVVILLHLLHAIEAEVKKSARDDIDSDHKR